MSEPFDQPDQEPAAAPDGQPDSGDKPAEIDWKAEARKWESRAKQNKAALDEAAPKLSEYDQLIEASKSDFERAQEEATRWQAEAERWRTASVGSRIHALAAEAFADPTDAVDMLAAAGKYLDAGGVIDDGAIRADLDELLSKKPHFRKAAPEPDRRPRVPAPNGHQGSGSGGPSVDPREQFANLLRAGGMGR